MSKREFEDYEREGMIDAIRCRRDEPTQYVPPDRGDKILSCYAAGTIRGRGVPSEQVGSVISTLLWLIKHANPTTGRCDPGVTKLCRETGYSKSSVLRALDTIENLEWMERERRQGRSTAYHLFFDRMVADFRYVEEQTRNEVVPYVTPPSPVRGTTPVSHVTPQESIKESVEEKAYPEWAPSPSALDASMNEKEKRASRKEEFVAGSTPNSESPESPIHP